MDIDIPGDQVDQFQCLPNQYRCPGTLTCISYHQLCDDTTDCPDGADEGGHCSKWAVCVCAYVFAHMYMIENASL